MFTWSIRKVRSKILNRSSLAWFSMASFKVLVVIPWKNFYPKLKKSQGFVSIKSNYVWRDWLANKSLCLQKNIFEISNIKKCIIFTSHIEEKERNNFYLLMCSKGKNKMLKIFLLLLTNKSKFFANFRVHQSCLNWLWSKHRILGSNSKRISLSVDNFKLVAQSLQTF